MTANEILDWLDLSIGTASKRDVRAVWYAFHDNNSEFVQYGSKLESLGLKAGRHYSLEHAMLDIGCES